MTARKRQEAWPEMCSWHKPKNKELGYIGFENYCEENAKQGLEQSRCPDCKRYLWPEEMGFAPTRQERKFTE